MRESFRPFPASRKLPQFSIASVLEEAAKFCEKNDFLQLLDQKG